MLFLAACRQQGSEKEKETEKPVEQEEKVSETPREEAEMSMVTAKTASPAKGQLSLKAMFGWGSGASQTAVVLVEKPMKTEPTVKQEVRDIVAQNSQMKTSLQASEVKLRFLERGEKSFLLL